MLKIIVPNNKEHWLELRRQVLTSTEIAALFDLSPYSTSFELWHRKKNNLEVEFEPNERVVWGTRLEKSVAEGIAEDNKWKIRKMDEFIFDDELKIGASFDYSIESDPLGILEIKCVDSLKFKNDWLVDGESIEATPQIEMQCQVQLLVSRREYLQLGALVGGNKVSVFKREPDLSVHAAIKEKAAAFWKSIDDNIPPTIDFKRDAEFISKLYGYAEVGKVMDAKGNGELLDLLRSYRQAQEEVKEADERKDGIKAQLLTLIGDSEKVLGDGWTISAGMVAGGPVSYIRKPYRGFKPSFKKDFA